MKEVVSSHVDSSWNPIFAPIRAEIEKILLGISGEKVTPPRDSIFRAFEADLNTIRCVIVGQDPYPTPGNAMGLSFSVPSSVTKLPQSLKNIFSELESDLDISAPSHGDLSTWANSGVLLLNRVLTTKPGVSNAHSHLGWQKITDHVAKELGSRGVVAILWGRQAQELSQYFTYKIESAHPSPLSAYKGFFGSKPFSRVNSLLQSSGQNPIDWNL